MNGATWLTAAGTLGVAVSAAFAGWEIREARKHATTAFEDTRAIEYRALVKDLPVAAFLKGGLSPQEIQDKLGVFYRYFDLSNEQAFLADAERISPETWSQWADGIVSNMRRQAFNEAWFHHIRDAAVTEGPDGKHKEDFDELRRLLKDRGIASLGAGAPPN